ncbi:Copper radical oxidase [Gigaspora rosea]|uniref:Copper radical oxidase n=1 Tax=Gigaspora rosea TaxID=44941 RepID=A0A397VMZ6_9GLOM|nr:Copper radical oxidase [Gigaspora rosea]
MKIWVYLYASIATFLWVAISYVNCQAALYGQFDFIGYSGVSSMHATLSPMTYKVLFIERVELSTNVNLNGKPTYSVEFDLATSEIRPLTTLSNTFCSAGSYLPNGTVVNLAGAEAKQGVVQGFNQIRLFNPCNNGTCDWHNDVYTLLTNRWYPTVEQLSDGTLFIIGGSTSGVSVNNDTINEPTFETYPSITGTKPVPFQFLKDTLPHNLYPCVHLLPDGSLFILANTNATILDTTTWKIKSTLPKIPGPPRNYPLTGGCTLLPLDPSNNNQPEVLVCGGGNNNDSNTLKNVKGEFTCGRISPLSNNPTWEMESMPFSRVMPDITMLADGTVLILNGCNSGTAGFNKCSDPVLTPVLYNPKAPAGSRFTKMQSPSYIPRMYHSIALSVPSGQVLVSGSNPNNNPSGAGPFPTEFRVELYSPPYLFTGVPQPQIILAPDSLKYGQSFEIEYKAFSGTHKVTANIHNPGFVTHSTHMSQRLVWLEITSSDNGKLSLKAPANGAIAPPGPYLLRVLDNGVPSNSTWIMLSK